MNGGPPPRDFSPEDTTLIPDRHRINSLQSSSSTLQATSTSISSTPPVSVDIPHHESDINDVYMIWCIYAAVFLLCLWLLIICAWLRYRHLINNVVMGTSISANDMNKGHSDASIEHLQVPLRQPSDVHFNTSDDISSFVLTPETSKIERATRRKKLS